MCQSCKQHKETENHFVRCKSEKRYNIWRKWLEDLDTYLSKPHTLIDIKDIIIVCMAMWLNDEPLPHLNTFPISVRATIRAQSNIGWDHFIRVRLTSSWGENINNQLQRSQIKNTTAEQWGTDLLNINWKHIITLWDQISCEQLGSNNTEKQEHRRQELIMSIQNLQTEYQDLLQSQQSLIERRNSRTYGSTASNVPSWSNDVNKTQKQSPHLSIRRPFLYKNKAELDPGEIRNTTIR
jgi:hypothetical protein